MAQPVLNLKSSKSRINTKRSVIGFIIDFSDINKELGVLIKQLGTPLAKELETKRVADEMAKGPIRNLSETFSSNSGRIRTLMDSIRAKPSYRSKTGSKTVGRYKLRTVSVSLANIPYMDKQTKISRLDKLFPPKHIAPFAGNPLKKTGQESKRRQSLWRIFEYVTKSHNKIPVRASGPVVYTTAKDGHSAFHIKESVTWFGSNRGAFSAYYLLDSSRQVYKEDQAVFSRFVANGVAKTIRERTRFRH